MTHVVTDACVNCKYTECVTVCPVNCFKAGKNMLVIDPDVCIDCGVCVIECPAKAIKADTEEGAEKWLPLNRKYAALWPEITEAKAPMKNADALKDTADKLKDLDPAPDPDEGS